MGFFATFLDWLDGRLTQYIFVYMNRVAAALEPAIVTVGTIYVMMWGFMHLTGRVEEPLTVGLKRIILLAVVFGVSLELWTYPEIIVSTFYDAPVAFAGAITRAPDPVSSVDTIWSNGAEIADNMIAKGGLLNGFGFYVAGVAVYILVGILCIYTVFLIALSKVALAILLALGPLFITMLLFDATRNLFTSWIAQLSNYALITILTIMVAALFMQEVEHYASETAALGSAILTVDLLDMILICVLATLFMRQITQVAALLSGGGIGLMTFDTVGRAVRFAGGRAGALASFAGKSALFARGMMSKRSGPDKYDRWTDSRMRGWRVKMKMLRGNAIEAAKPTELPAPDKK